MNYFHNYNEFKELEKMKARLRQEIADLKLSVGDTQIVTSLRATLATVYSRQGRMERGRRAGDASDEDKKRDYWVKSIHPRWTTWTKSCF